MNPKKFKKGKHSYTDWGKGIKEVKKVSETKSPKQLKIKIDDSTSEGKYCNMASITHTREEFIIDFILRSPGVNQAKVVSRVITSPGHAKRVMMALTENISRYEKANGKIVLNKQPEEEIRLN